MDIAELPQIDPRSASEGAARRQLLRDWNRPYDAIEKPALAKVRLIQRSQHAVTGQAMQEYGLEGMAQAAEVAWALNAASGRPVLWRLDRLENAAKGGTVGVGRVNGVWQAALQ
jgi:hypothetical protein